MVRIECLESPRQMGNRDGRAATPRRPAAVTISPVRPGRHGNPDPSPCVWRVTACTIGLCLAGAATAATGDGPESGLWFDRRHEGHGLDLHRAGTTLFGAFYTYGADGQTRWLWLQVNDQADPQGSLWQVERGAPGLRLVDVGAFSLTRAEACVDGQPRPAARALRQFEYQVDGVRDSWCVEPLLPERPLAMQAFDGAWYDPLDPGWGLFAHHYQRADAELWTYRSLYFHDSAGRPRWAFAQSRWPAPDLLQRYYTPAAECFGCPPPVALTSEVGLAWIDLQDSGIQPPAGSNPAVIRLSLDGDEFARDTTLRLLSEPRLPSAAHAVHRD